VTRAALPDNLHTMSAEALRGVCAAHGIPLPKGKNPSKSALIKAIEMEVFKSENNEVLLLE